ncbi:MAG: polysaccharide deacetylase family protein [Dokdonella sp.]
MSGKLQLGASSQNRGKRQKLAHLVGGLGLLPLVQRVRNVVRTELRILAYHRVRDVVEEEFDFDLALVSATPEQFRAQVAWLKKEYTPIRLCDVIDVIAAGRPLPPKAVVITFDDGYDDNYHVAFPILREFGVPATFFVSTGYIDSGASYAYDWLVHLFHRSGASRVVIPELRVDTSMPPDRCERAALAERVLDRIKALPEIQQAAIIGRLEDEWSIPRKPHADSRPMNWGQLREMHAAGMEIGSHGVHHWMLAQLPHDEMAAELAGSRSTLERELESPAQVISYPVGGPDAYNDAVIAEARAQKFAIGCSYVSGSNPWPLVDPYALLRLPVERYMDPVWFKGMLAWPELFSHRSRRRAG